MAKTNISILLFVEFVPSAITQGQKDPSCKNQCILVFMSTIFTGIRSKIGISGLAILNLKNSGNTARTSTKSNMVLLRKFRISTSHAYQAFKESSLITKSGKDMSAMNVTSIYVSAALFTISISQLLKLQDLKRFVSSELLMRARNTFLLPKKRLLKRCTKGNMRI